MLEPAPTSANWSTPLCDRDGVKYWIETFDYEKYTFVVVRKNRRIRSSDSFGSPVAANIAACQAIDRYNAIANADSDTEELTAIVALKRGNGRKANT